MTPFLFDNRADVCYSRNMKAERAIYKLAESLISQEYNPYALYRLRRARLYSKRKHGVRSNMVYGVPKSWR